MKILILHLSDLHIRSGNDWILERNSEITNIVRNIEYQLDMAFILITGDISFEGSTEQLIYGYEFLSKLSNILEGALSSSVSDGSIQVNLIAIPGNHDCNFSRDNTVRELLIKSILKDMNAANKSTVIKECLKVQDEFFECRDTYAAKGLINQNRLYYEYEFSHKSEKILFKCVNTAWISQKEEQQGELIYPINRIPQNKGDESLVITLFHHPYPWLETCNGREFRKKVESISDIILTGHEHDVTFRTQESTEGERNTYIEGGVLQEKETKKSEFNVLIIDTEAKKQKFLNASWNVSRYEPAKDTVFEGDNGALSWHDYQVNSLRLKERFMPNKETMCYLEDPGANFNKKNYVLTLLDIYVPPDLRSVPQLPTQNTKHIGGDEIVEFIKSNRHILIVGDYQSGKTSLCKYLFLSLNNMGDVPLLIDGKNIKIKKSFENFLEVLFSEQYDEKLLESFRQMDRNKRVVIIDDYHHLKLSSKKKNKFISWLCDFAGSVILIADELELNIKEVLYPDSISEGRESFDYYVIQPFGYRRRDVLIKKWLTKKIDSDQNSIDVDRTIDSISKILDTLIGKNYVPAYPIYIVSVLFASDTATSIDLSASTHGYFYELIIKIVITSGRTSLEYDIAASYLAYLAYQMFKKRSLSLDTERLKAIHEDFQKKYVIERSYEKIKSQLLEQHILVERDGQYSFKYKFMYYYFVASYLRDNLTRTQEIKEDISQLSEALYVEEYANIMLFLAHLSKDPYIIEEMIKRADVIFDNSEPSHLEEDIDFIGNLDSIKEELIVEEKKKERVREEILDEKDRIDEEPPTMTRYNEPVDADVFKSNSLLQLGASIRTLEIMGQMLKNFPGSMEADDKLRLTNSCYNLGLRTLASTLNIIKGNEKELLKDFIKVINHKHPQLDYEKASQKALESIVCMSQIIGFCMIKRISYSIGTPELFPIYKKMLEKYPYASVKLIDCSLAVDQASYFPDSKIVNLSKELSKKWFPFEILRRIVALHLYLFDVQHTKRQRVCQELNIQYKYLQSASTKRKMLKGK